MRLFERTFRVTAQTTVLDVGGSPLIWQFAKVKPKITFLNFPSALERAPGAELVAGDGRFLPFRDASFDIVFSNSTIEHVGGRAEQQKFADEISRVGKSYWVQTPNRYFPFEMHLMLPLVHYLPRRWQRPLVTRFTGWEMLVEPSEAQRHYYIKHFLTELHLLSAAELRQLFPNASITKERALGWAKSLIAYKV